MDSFKKFSEDKLPDRCEFYSSLKDGFLILIQKEEKTLLIVLKFFF